jgi:hypothetical protein
MADVNQEFDNLTPEQKEYVRRVAIDAARLIGAMSPADLKDEGKVSQAMQGVLRASREAGEPSEEAQSSLDRIRRERAADRADMVGNGKKKPHLMEDVQHIAAVTAALRKSGGKKLRDIREAFDAARYAAIDEPIYRFSLFAIGTARQTFAAVREQGKRLGKFFRRDAKVTNVGAIPDTGRKSPFLRLGTALAAAAGVGALGWTFMEHHGAIADSLAHVKATVASNSGGTDTAMVSDYSFSDVRLGIDKEAVHRFTTAFNQHLDKALETVGLHHAPTPETVLAQTSDHAQTAAAFAPPADATGGKSGVDDLLDAASKLKAQGAEAVQHKAAVAPHGADHAHHAAHVAAHHKVEQPMHFEHETQDRLAQVNVAKEHADAAQAVQAAQPLASAVNSHGVTVVQPSPEFKQALLEHLQKIHPGDPERAKFDLNVAMDHFDRMAANATKPGSVFFDPDKQFFYDNAPSGTDVHNLVTLSTDGHNTICENGQVVVTSVDGGHVADVVHQTSTAQHAAAMTTAPVEPTVTYGHGSDKVTVHDATKDVSDFFSNPQPPVNPPVDYDKAAVHTYDATDDINGFFHRLFGSDDAKTVAQAAPDTVVAQTSDHAQTAAAFAPTDAAAQHVTVEPLPAAAPAADAAQHAATATGHAASHAHAAAHVQHAATAVAADGTFVNPHGVKVVAPTPEFQKAMADHFARLHPNDPDAVQNALHRVLDGFTSNAHKAPAGQTYYFDGNGQMVGAFQGTESDAALRHAPDVVELSTKGVNAINDHGGHVTTMTSLVDGKPVTHDFPAQATTVVPAQAVDAVHAAAPAAAARPGAEFSNALVSHLEHMGNGHDEAKKLADGYLDAYAKMAEGCKGVPGAHCTVTFHPPGTSGRGGAIMMDGSGTFAMYGSDGRLEAMEKAGRFIVQNQDHAKDVAYQAAGVRV